MKKVFILFAFALFALSASAQMNKVDAGTFIERNFASISGINIFNTVDQNGGNIVRGFASWDKANLVSMTAKDSGIWIVVKQDGANRDKFFPYTGILYMVVSGNNMINIFLHD